jgi:hypothetical protein
MSLELGVSDMIDPSPHSPEEPSFKIEMEDFTEFSLCLESVKYTAAQKGHYADVILIAAPLGITLKSASKTGTIMSTVQMKPDLFKSYTFYSPASQNNDSQHTAEQIEFCIPFIELKHIVDSMETDSGLTITYPVGDNKLGVQIIDALSPQNPGQVVTNIHFDVYDAKFSLDVSYNF